MTPYRIVFAPSTVRQLENLHHPVSARIMNAVSALSSDPFSGKPLQGRLQGLRSLRVGDYRVVYEVHHRLIRVEIVRIAHRREVYR